MCISAKTVLSFVVGVIIGATISIAAMKSEFNKLTGINF
jgi:uncharacterized protein YneF (UPF0154 family)